jgi:hypothetical protein
VTKFDKFTEQSFIDFLEAVYNETLKFIVEADKINDPQTEYEYEIWLKQKKDRKRVKFRLSESTTYEIVKLFFEDRKRLIGVYSRSFPEGINICKIAGYFCYWIAKLKPILIIGSPDKSEIQVNEYFAIFVAVVLLDNEYRLPLEPIPTRIICDLINVLRYDSFDANLCIMVNEMIVKDCKKRRT